jgi:hypothetical protein
MPLAMGVAVLVTGNPFSWGAKDWLMMIAYGGIIGWVVGGSLFDNNLS